MSIHPTAIIDPSAQLAEDVSVGPFTVIGPKVEIGSGTKIAANVVIAGPTTIGKNNEIFSFSAVGEAPQDKKYGGEDTRLEIGDDNIIREFCTLHRGTIQDKGLTKVGSGNLLMAYVHIAHDCVVGDNNIFANNASLAGHVTVGNYVTLGGFAGIHQFCRIGDHSFLGRAPIVVKDVLPYVMIAGRDPQPHGLNVEGLKRRGFEKDTIYRLKEAYKIIFKRGNTVDDAIPQLAALVPACQEIQAFIDFLKISERGIHR